MADTRCDVTMDEIFAVLSRLEQTKHIRLFGRDKSEWDATIDVPSKARGGIDRTFDYVAPGVYMSRAIEGITNVRPSFMLIRQGPFRAALYEPINGADSELHKVALKGYKDILGMRHITGRSETPTRVSAVEIRDVLATMGLREEFKVFEIRSSPILDIQISIVRVVDILSTETKLVTIPASRVVEWGVKPAEHREVHKEPTVKTFYVAGEAVDDILRAIIETGAPPADAPRADVHDAVRILKHLGVSVRYYA